MPNVVKLHPKPITRIDLIDKDHIPREGDQQHVVEMELPRLTIVLDFGATAMPPIADPVDQLHYLRDVILPKRDVGWHTKGYARDIIDSILRQHADSRRIAQELAGDFERLAQRLRAP